MSNSRLTQFFNVGVNGLCGGMRGPVFREGFSFTASGPRPPLVGAACPERPSTALRYAQGERAGEGARGRGVVPFWCFPPGRAAPSTRLRTGILAACGLEARTPRRRKSTGGQEGRTPREKNNRLGGRVSWRRNLTPPSVSDDAPLIRPTIYEDQDVTVVLAVESPPASCLRRRPPMRPSSVSIMSCRPSALVSVRAV